MRDVHFGVHPAFGYIWLLINFCDYLIANRTGRMIIGLFAEIIKLNENKKSDFKRVKN